MADPVPRKSSKAKTPMAMTDSRSIASLLPWKPRPAGRRRQGRRESPSTRRNGEAGYLNNLNHVVGSSAGALTALCLASGFNSNNFQDLADNTNLLGLVKSPKTWARSTPWFSLRGPSVQGGNALQTADQATGMMVYQFLSDDTKATKAKLDELYKRRKPSRRGGDKRRWTACLSCPSLRTSLRIAPARWSRLRICVSCSR